MSDDMGTFRTDVVISNLSARERRIRVSNVLVDTDAELSWLPKDVLESLGVGKEKIWHFRQADGTVLARRTGFALIRVGEIETPDEVVFGELGDLVLLGSRTLEGLNVKVDPVNRLLVDAGPAPAAAAA